VVALLRARWKMLSAPNQQITPSLLPPLYLAGLLGWMANFSLHALMQFKVGGPGMPRSLWFLAALVAALIPADIFLNRHADQTLLWARSALFGCAVITAVAVAIPSPLPPWWHAPAGAAAGAALTAWSRWFSHVVAVSHRGRAVALAVAGASPWLWLSEQLPGPAVYPVLSLIALLLAWLALQPAAELTAPAVTSDLPQRRRARTILHGGLFLAAFAALLLFNPWLLPPSPSPSPAARFLMSVAFLAGVFAAALSIDWLGLKGMPVAGGGLLLAASLTALYGRETGSSQFTPVIFRSLYGFLLPLPFLYLARAAAPRAGGRWISRGLLLYAVPAALSPLLPSHHGTAVPYSVTGLAALGALVTLVGLPTSLEPSATPPDAVPPPAPSSVEPPSALSTPDLLDERFGGQLSSREIEVGRLAIQGVPSREIAQQLFLSENTVKSHLRSLYRKTGTANRNELFRKLVEEGVQELAAPGEQPGLSVGSMALPRDPATGFLARPAYESILRAELKAVRIHGRPVTVMAVVLQAVNGENGFGHPTRNQWLAAVAGILGTSIRSADTIFRWEEERFVILLPASELTTAQTVRRRIERNVENWARERAFTLHMAIRCASTAESLGSPAELLSAAEQGLYSAEGGRSE
jgi:diguanylate cyclase (GGDEF)-like protein